MDNTPHLKHRLELAPSGQESDSVYCRGLSKHASNQDIVDLLSEIEAPIEVDFSCRSRGVIWAKFSSIAVARRAVAALHQKSWRGTTLSVRFELGVDANNRPITPSSSHNTLVRQIRYEPESADLARRAHYSHFAVHIDRAEFPFPSGLYLARVLQLTRKLSPDDPLLQIVTDMSMGHGKYTKEISESMAMVDAVERAMKLVYGRSGADLPRYVQVFVLGDGKQPLTAACLCLHCPGDWKFVSIDPLLQILPVGAYSSRFVQFAGYSQAFVLPEEERTVPSLSIIVACHSHAPLEEFWMKTPSPKLCVSMPCCADYSRLPAGVDPVLEFQDFEVYSAKRTVRIYAAV